MNFLQKLDFMMEKYSLNKRTLSQNSGIPYTTIDGWYKKGYEGMKVSTLRILSDYFNTVVNFWVTDEITDPNAWKVDGFVVTSSEMEHVQKYRLLDQNWKKAVDSILDTGYEACTAQPVLNHTEQDNIVYITRWFPSHMSAGTGQPASSDEPEELELIKRPPRGTSYVAPVSGNSMEPTYRHGDKLFIRACEKIEIGQIGVFFMDGQQWVKELGDGILISHNGEYAPKEFTEDIKCQGLVLGVCDESYLR